MKKLKCKYCTEEWYIEDNVIDKFNSCPFCSKILREKAVVQGLDSLDKVIYSTVVKNGTDMFLNAQQLFGYLLDVAPNLKKEIRIFSRVFDNDYLKILRNAFEQEMNEAEKSLSKLKFLFIEEEGVAENWADMLCDSCLKAVMYTKGLGLPDIVNAEIVNIDSLIEDIVLTEDEIIRNFRQNISKINTVNTYERPTNIQEFLKKGNSYKKIGDYGNAFRYFNMAAVSNDSEALYELGECYYYGKGTNKDWSKSELMYRKSDKIPSFLQIEQMYRKNTQNVYNAYEIYLRMSEKNNPKGQFFMGYFYQYGICVSMNKKMAVEYYEKAAKNGLIQGLTKLGICYVKGEGVERNFKKATNYLEIASEYNDEEAMKYLKMCN